MRTKEVNKIVLEAALNKDSNADSVIVPIPFNLIVYNNYGKTISANNGYRTIKNKYVAHKYSIVANNVMKIIPFLNKYSNAIIAYISSAIKPNSNIICIKNEHIASILDTDKVHNRDFYTAISELIKCNIIYKPNIKVIMLLILLLYLKVVLLNLLKIIILIFKVITPLLLMIK